MKWTTYSAIFGTVLIGIVIVSKLSGLGTVVEPNEPISYDPEFGDFTLTTKKIWLSIEIEDEPNFADLEDRIYLYQGGEYDIVIEKKEPNEPNEIIDAKSYEESGNYEPPKPKKYSLPIPTWPDYIELDKELRIDFSDNSMSVGWSFPKGTKIYFKDD